MKTGAFILLVLFVFMSMQPMFIKWSSAPSCTEKASPKKIALKSTACKKTCSEPETPPVSKTAGEKSGSSSNTCNPFLVCNGCTYIPAERPNLSLPAGEDIENTNWLNDDSPSSFGSGFWRPPELFMHL